MDNSKISIDRLNEHLFDVIERLKEGNDPDADKKDTIDLERASKICEAGKIIVDTYKVKAQVFNAIVKSGNTNVISRFINSSGIAQIPESTAVNIDTHIFK